MTVFFLPEFSDTYGNRELNANIRKYKDISLEFASGSDNPESLIEKFKTSSENYIDETKRTYETIEKTLSGKIQDVKTAADSVEKAYQAINEAKSNIDKVVNSTT